MANGQTGGLLLPNIQTPNFARVQGAAEKIQQNRATQALQQKRVGFEQQNLALRKQEFGLKQQKSQNEVAISNLEFIGKVARTIKPDDFRSLDLGLKNIELLPGMKEFAGQLRKANPSGLSKEDLDQLKGLADHQIQKLGPLVSGISGGKPSFGRALPEGGVKVVEGFTPIPKKERSLNETTLAGIASGAIKDPNITQGQAKQIQANITKTRQERKGAGITTTLPDGTVIQIGGKQPDKAPGFGVAASGEIQKDLLAATEGLARLSQIENSIDDRFLTIPGKFQAAVLNIKDMAGGFLGIKGLTTEERGFLSDFSTFAQDSIENINLYIKQITGAQMSEAEAVRLRKAISDIGDGLFTGDGPAKFRAKLANQVRKLRMGIARLNWINKKGIRGDFGPKMQGIERKLPLERMPAIMAKRESEIISGFRASLPGRTQQEYEQLTSDRLAEEFGLVP